MYLAKKSLGIIFKHNACCCTSISEDQVGLKRQFGRHMGRMEPGFHCVPWACGYTVGGFVSTKVRQVEIESPCLTGDLVPIHFRALLTWNLGEAAEAERVIPTKLEVKLVSSVALQILSRHLGRTKWSDLRSGRAWRAGEQNAGAQDEEPPISPLQKAIQDEIQVLLNPRGILLVGVFVFEISPNPELKNSYIRLSTATPSVTRNKELMSQSAAIYTEFSKEQLAKLWARADCLDKLKDVASTSKSSSLFIGAEGIGQPKSGFGRGNTIKPKESEEHTVVRGNAINLEELEELTVDRGYTSNPDVHTEESEEHTEGADLRHSSRRKPSRNKEDAGNHVAGLINQTVPLP